ncbi:DUF805 domain-containing protein [Ancylobacter sp. G4_0304]|uniref:DUF805 domain-containing protein n=1 Tax=Ancylobacter sp. G4_0304 TaxID=3114289 RepID=UPI0039C73922
MTFSSAVSSVLGKYATFSGRAPRSEYWWWVLFTILVNWVATFVDTLLFGEFYLMHYEEIQVFTPITTLIGLALTLPSIAVGARRFHDLRHSGWWLLIGLTGIGALVIFFWFMRRGTEGPNRYGPDPLDHRPI